MRRNSRSGSAAVEFAFVAPILLLFLFGIIETGVIFFASSALQNATDDTARLIRTGQLTGTLTASQLRTKICAEVSGLISSATCAANLQVDLHSYSDFSGASFASVTNADGSINTSQLSVGSTGSCKVVLMRSFYPWTIMTPLMAPLLENMPNGQYLIATAAAFRTEPYVSGSSC
jgi:Flp pilus assembly protein TadG